MPKSDALKIRMIEDNILVEPIAENRSVGKILLVETSDYKEAPRKGKVVSISARAKKIGPMRPGDVVLYDMPREQRRIDGKEYAWLHTYEIYGILLGEKAEEVQAIGESIFLSWDFATAEYGKTGIIRPVTHEKMHYTGNVISVGEGVYDVRPGDRIFFDQFSNPGKFQDGAKRYAFIREQDALAIIPERVEVHSPDMVLA